MNQTCAEHGSTLRCGFTISLIECLMKTCCIAPCCTPLLQLAQALGFRTSEIYAGVASSSRDLPTNAFHRILGRGCDDSATCAAHE